MTVRRRLETALASAAALLSNLRARLSPAPCDLVGAVLCALAALFLILYAASGFSDAPWFAVHLLRHMGQTHSYIWISHHQVNSKAVR